MDLELPQFDMRGLVEDVANLLAESARAKGLEVTTVIAPDVPVRLGGDSVHLRQILMNLLANVIQFTDQGEVVVDVKLTERSDSDVLLAFEVRDTGIGIGAERAALLVESFSGADGSIAPTDGGAGACSRLAESMGGEIGLLTTAGVRSGFWFTARLEVVDGELLTQPASRDEGSWPRLLLAEDNLVNQRVVVAMLDKIGYRIEIVANGAEAVEALSRASYAAVLMDCQMPVMDGYDATREIRRREAGARHTPIIAVTARAMRDDRERCLEAGMDDYISKPVDLDLLEAVLSRWVQEEDDGQGQNPADADADADAGAERSLGANVKPHGPAGRRFDHDQVAMLRSLRMEGEPDLFALTGQIFLDTAPGNLTTLCESVASRDAPATLRAAHSLKGSGASLGAAGLARACAELEAAARLGAGVAEAEALACVEEEFRLAQEWLMEQLG